MITLPCVAFHRCWLIGLRKDNDQVKLLERIMRRAIVPDVWLFTLSTRRLFPTVVTRCDLIPMLPVYPIFSAWKPERLEIPEFVLWKDWSASAPLRLIHRCPAMRVGYENRGLQ
jgi:hypothetical protein